MNTSRLALLSRFAIAAGLVAATAAAHAGGGVYWSVNVDAPIQGAGRVSTAVSNTRWGVAPQQGYYAPAPVVYAPPPVVYAPPAVVVQPSPVYGYVPAPVVYAPPRRCEPRGPWAWRHHHHHEDERMAWNEGGEWQGRAPRGYPAPRDRDDDRGWRYGH